MIIKNSPDIILNLKISMQTFCKESEVNSLEDGGL